LASVHFHAGKPSCGTDTPAKARAAINKLRAEAAHVPDPGGPIGNYSDALAAWAAANHPKIDPHEMFMHIVDKLIFDHR